MLTRPLARLARAPHTLRVAGARFYSPGQTGDVGHQAHVSDLAAKDSKKATAFDAASPEAGKHARRDGLSGNQENVGFADQVGSQSASGRPSKTGSAEGSTGTEDITPPAFGDVIKKVLGMKTTAGEDKQNRGGGKGVTGTGHPTFDAGKRTMHTTATRMNETTTGGQAPKESRQTQDRTYGEQNAHLKHKSDPSKPDHGKGNAAEGPTLPSQHFQVDASWKPSSSAPQQTRQFSTTARVYQEDKETKHTAETYFKDVDSTQPANPKVHQVEPSSGSASVARANEQPVTGEFSRAGSQTKEYETAGKQDKPYDTPPTQGPEADEKLRYGGKSRLEIPKGEDEGPTGKNKGGRS